MIRRTVAAFDEYVAWTRGLLTDHRPSRGELRLLAEGIGTADPENHSHYYLLKSR